MKKLPLLLILSLLAILTVSGCTGISQTEPDPFVSQPSHTPTDLQATESPKSTFTPIPSITPTQSLSSLQGPILLIQSGPDEYQYLSPKTQTSILVDLPVTNPQFRLSANLSPSGNLMLFPQQDDTGLILDIRTGEIIHTYDFANPGLFNPQQAVIEAQPLAAELGLTDAALLDAVNQAHQSSISQLRWFRDDRYHLSVQDSGETSTALFLDDHQTGTRLQLEDQPGLVGEFRVSPDGETILVKKNLIFHPGAHPFDRYYLINVNDQSTQLVQLPEVVQNPSMSWFSGDTLSVIHQAFMTGGSGFSLVDTQTMQASQVFTGEFSSIRRIGSNLFIIQQDDQTGNTMFELMSIDGEVLASHTQPSRCFFQYLVGDQIIIQCDLQSFIMDQDLNIDPFIDAIQSLSPSPDGSSYVMINRSENVFLLDSDLTVANDIPIEGIPIEIRWLPDSSGFLYRTHGRLDYFDLINQTNHLLLESDIFSDYTNINAIWINFD